MLTLKAIERFYYQEMEEYRLHNAPMEKIKTNFLDIYSSLNIQKKPVITISHGGKSLTVYIKEPNISPRQVFTILESLTNDEIEVMERPEIKEIGFRTSIGQYKLIVDMSLNANNTCKYVEVGKQEVPIYELNCEDE
jgi:hypothetical protein